MASRLELDKLLSEMELAEFSQTGAPTLLGSGDSREQQTDSEHSPREDELGSPPCSRRRGLTGAAALAIVGVSVVGACAVAWQRGGAPTHSPGEKVALASIKCHTALEGEPCHDDVKWAMEIGIEQHPEWYSKPCESLNKNSMFEEFQACVFKINATTCPLPCNPAKLTKPGTDEVTLPTTTTTKTPSKEKQSHSCHTALAGEKCYGAVIDAMTDGIKTSPDDFEGLTADSSFEDFQIALSKGEASICPEPCSCHTAEVPEKCAEDVEWAMTEGISAHPKWYPGLNASSTWEEFQSFLHKDPSLGCPKPCTAKPGGKKKVTTTEESTTTEEAETVTTTPKELSTKKTTTKAVTTKQAPTTAEATTPKSTTTRKPPCHTAVEGDKCYTDVMYGMTQGLWENPDWYPGLTAQSTFEDFQMLLSMNEALDCPEPCACSNAEKGSECMESMKWVLEEGIASKPAWYQGLTETSRFEEVQKRLSMDEDSDCDTPCTPKKWGSPSLFCWSLYRAEGYEVDLVKTHVEKMVGIFACDEFLPLCDEVLDLGNGISTTSIGKTDPVGVSKDGTAANTLVFMIAWNAVYDDFRYHAHDWVLKADPDAVLLPDRMRPKLAQYPSTVYIKNCNLYDGPGWPMMFGSLEAISRPALQLYYDNRDRCRTELEWEAWGEDLWLGNCLDMLGAESVGDFNIIGDGVCTGADCSDGLKATYHPFKNAEDWFNCYNQAMNSGGDGQ